MKMIYLAYDCNGAQDELINGVAYETEASAREAVYNFLKDNAGYDPEDWLDFAVNAGFKTVEELQEAIRQSSDYDEEMMVRVDTIQLLK